MGSFLDDYLRAHMGELINEKTEYTFPPLAVQKMTGTILVSNDLLMDMGIIPDTRPPRKPPTRRERFRWWRSGLRDRIATWAYERISGDEFPSRED